MDIQDKIKIAAEKLNEKEKQEYVNAINLMSVLELEEEVKKLVRKRENINTEE